jgi:photosystem II stability/assembly factor-like uncharacterized protein
MKLKTLACLFLLIAGALGSLPITHASGRFWVSSFSPTTENLFDVFMVNATDGWIVGDSGTILHWNGTEWSQVSQTATTANLRGIYMYNSSEGWAVGLSGTTIHWNGTEWESVTSGTSANLLGIGATTYLGPNYYVVGAEGTLLWWNKTAGEWQPQSVPTSAGLRDIDMYYFMILVPFPTPHFDIIKNGWAVGDSGTILHWDGSWNDVTSPTTAQLSEVCRISSDDAWAAGSGWAMIHWDGTEWSNVTTPKSGYGYFSALDMVNATDGWAMGYGGAIIHWDGTEWSEVTSPTTNVLNAVYMVNATDGWAVGNGGTIIRWTGTEWIPEISTSLVMPLLISLTLVAVVIAKTLPKKRRSEWIPSET